MTKLDATVEGWDIKINAADLIASLSDEAKATIGQAAACDRYIMKAVVDQLVAGQTEDGSFGADVDAMRRRLVEAMDWMRSEVIRNMAIELDAAQRAAADERRRWVHLSYEWERRFGERAPMDEPPTDWEAWSARRRTVEQIASDLTKATSNPATGGVCPCTSGGAL